MVVYDFVFVCLLRFVVYCCGFIVARFLVFCDCDVALVVCLFDFVFTSLLAA